MVGVGSLKCAYLPQKASETAWDLEGCYCRICVFGG